MIVCQFFLPFQGWVKFCCMARPHGLSRHLLSPVAAMPSTVTNTARHTPVCTRFWFSLVHPGGEGLRHVGTLFHLMKKGTCYGHNQRWKESKGDRVAGLNSRKNCLSLFLSFQLQPCGLAALRLKATLLPTHVHLGVISRSAHQWVLWTRSHRAHRTEAAN